MRNCEKHQHVSVSGLCPVCLVQERDKLAYRVSTLERLCRELVWYVIRNYDDPIDPDLNPYIASLARAAGFDVPVEVKDGHES